MNLAIAIIKNNPTGYVALVGEHGSNVADSIIGVGLTELDAAKKALDNFYGAPAVSLTPQEIVKLAKDNSNVAKFCYNGVEREVAVNWSSDGAFGGYDYSRKAYRSFRFDEIEGSIRLVA